MVSPQKFLKTITTKKKTTKPCEGGECDIWSFYIIRLKWPENQKAYEETRKDGPFKGKKINRLCPEKEFMANVLNKDKITVCE